MVWGTISIVLVACFYVVIWHQKCEDKAFEPFTAQQFSETLSGCKRDTWQDSPGVYCSEHLRTDCPRYSCVCVLPPSAVKLWYRTSLHLSFRFIILLYIINHCTDLYVVCCLCLLFSLWYWYKPFFIVIKYQT